MSKEAYKSETLMEETKQLAEAVKCIAAQWVIQPQENGAWQINEAKTEEQCTKITCTDQSEPSGRAVYSDTVNNHKMDSS